VKTIRLIGCLVLLFGFSSAFSQTRTWLQDYDKAAALAKSSGKTLLIDFSGSDWCPWCIRLDKEVFSQKAFQSYARRSLVLLLADFPSKKELPEKAVKQNAALAKKYEISGYPTVVLVSSKGELIGTTGYVEGGAQAYVKHLQGIISEYRGKK
jgi:protein disulfide-isomerase